MKFADELKSARTLAGLSQPAAADLLNVSVTTLRNWERGRTEPPTRRVWTQDEVINELKNQGR